MTDAARVSPESPRIFALACHPASPTEVVKRLEVHVDVHSSGVLRLGYVLEADLARVRIPPLGKPRRAHGLWRHTCFEVFAMRDGGPAYLELNFAPSSEWAAYSFDDYRDGMRPADPAPAHELRLSRRPRQLELGVELHLDVSRHLRLALAAVAEDDNGTLSFWALKHPSAGADFHHPDGFAIEINL